VIDGASQLVCVEIEASATVSSDDFKRIKWFSKEEPARSSCLPSDHDVLLSKS